MAESVALRVDEVLPHEPMRQWVLSMPFALRFLFASRPAIMGKVLGIVYPAIATHQVKKAWHNACGVRRILLTALRSEKSFGT